MEKNSTPLKAIESESHDEPERTENEPPLANHGKRKRHSEQPKTRECTIMARRRSLNQDNSVTQSQANPTIENQDEPSQQRKRLVLRLRSADFKSPQQVDSKLPSSNSRSASNSKNSTRADTQTIAPTHPVEESSTRTSSRHAKKPISYKV
jgi:hypothetical protein